MGTVLCELVVNQRSTESEKPYDLKYSVYCDVPYHNTRHHIRKIQDARGTSTETHVYFGVQDTHAHRTMNHPHAHQYFSDE